MSTQFLISTVSTNVTVSDLGLVLTHPVVDRDLALEFSAEDIAASEDLTAAIQGGTLTVKIQTEEYGAYQVDPGEYTSFSLLEQALPSFEKEAFLIEAELAAGYLDSFIRDAVFPFTLSSTTAVTNVVVATNAAFQDWRVAPEDVIGIFGTGVSDGYFTVESVTNQTTLVTVEPLATSSGVGTFAIYNPPGAKRVGVDTRAFNQINDGYTNLQDILVDIDYRLGQQINIEEHRDLDQLVHEVAEDAYTEYTYVGNQVTNITVYTDSGKGTKIREEQFTYSGTRVDTAVTIQYNAAGSIVERLTETYTYSGVQVASVDSVLEEF